ncbi:RICIN domain-containing protein [Streptomyces sp. NPDC003710]
MATTLLLLGGLLAGGAPAASADASQPFATYNMEGSLNGERWTSEVGPLAEHNAVVVLQEVGNGPPPEPRQLPGQGRSIPIPPNPLYPNLPRSVNHTLWDYNNHIYSVYFLQTDSQRSAAGVERWRGGRVNLAVVTRDPVDEVRVLENPRYDPNGPNNAYRYRRALGVRVGDTWYYNVHGRGRDFTDMLRQIRAQRHSSWVLVGDFNVNIRYRSTRSLHDSLHLQPFELLERPDRATHQNDSELDFAITRGVPRMTATVPAGRGADHYAVQFEAAPTPPLPTAETHTFSSAFVNAATGSALDIPDDGSGRVITHPRRYNPQQRFHMTTVLAHWYRFEHGGSGGLARRDGAAADARCPGITPNPIPLQQLVMQSCDNVTAQWSPEDPAAPGGPLIWRNSYRPQLCLTGLERQGPAVAMPCTGADNQRWWDNSRAIGESSWSTVAPGEGVKLRSAASGSMLDAQGGGTSDLTRVIAHPRKDVDNQRWYIHYVDSADNLFRISSAASVRSECVDVLDSDRAGPESPTILYRCDDPNSKNDGAGHRWQVETYNDGSLRFRNEATHLCMVAPVEPKGQVTVNACNDDDLRQAWFVEW